MVTIPPVPTKQVLQKQLSIYRLNKSYPVPRSWLPDLTPIKLVQQVLLLNCIRQVLASNLDRDIDYAEVFMVFLSPSSHILG
jgi:hypothetical protein